MIPSLEPVRLGSVPNARQLRHVCFKVAEVICVPRGWAPPAKAAGRFGPPQGRRTRGGAERADCGDRAAGLPTRREIQKRIFFRD